MRQTVERTLRLGFEQPYRLAHALVEWRYGRLRGHRALQDCLVKLIGAVVVEPAFSGQCQFAIEVCVDLAIEYLHVTARQRAEVAVDGAEAESQVERTARINGTR